MARGCNTLRIMSSQVHRKTLTLLLVFGLLAPVLTTSSPAGASPEPAPVEDPPVIWGVTDSVFWAAAPYLDERLPDHQAVIRGFPGLHLRTVLGYQLTAELPLPPGPGLMDGPGVLANDSHLIDDIVVVGLGNMFWGDDATNPQRYERWINEFLDHTDNARRVLWIRPRLWDERGSGACGRHKRPCNGWMRTVNELLDRAAKRHPNVELLDWAAELEGHEDEWLTPDGIHLMGIDDGTLGAGAMADFVANAILESPTPGSDEPGRKAPIGRLNKVRVGPEKTIVKGYAFRPVHDRPIPVTITVDGDVVKRRTTSISVIGLAERTSALSDNHGFKLRIPTPAPGDHTVCLWVGGKRLKMNCKDITVEPIEPPGS